MVQGKEPKHEAPPKQKTSSRPEQSKSALPLSDAVDKFHTDQEHISEPLTRSSSRHKRKDEAPGARKLSKEQHELMRLWRPDSLVDIFSEHELLRPGWRPGKIVSCAPVSGSSSVCVVVHVLGSSSHCNEKLIVSHGETMPQIATFGSKSTVFETGDEGE